MSLVKSGSHTGIIEENAKQLPEISVVMPTYNGDKWIRESIDSVLNQTFENFELLIIDDGSSDSTKEIIENYKKADKRIITVYKSHTGATDSQNVGINIARGSWIARIDQDDICEPERLSKQLAFVYNNPEIDLLGSGFIEIDKDGNYIKKHSFPRHHKRLTANLETLRRFFPHSSAFYRLDAARKVGKYNIRFIRADDWDLWQRLSEQGKIACLAEPLVKIRKHAGQMSLLDNNKRSFLDAATAGVCHFLRKAGYNNIPSLDKSEENWFLFLNWVEKRMVETDIVLERKIWIDAREEYFYSQKNIKNKFFLMLRLTRSGHLVSLLKSKMFGLSMPEKLAYEWMIISKAVTITSSKVKVLSEY